VYPATRPRVIASRGPFVVIVGGDLAADLAHLVPALLDRRAHRPHG
jgi:hypothetical protein